MLIVDTANRVIFDWHFCKLFTTVIVEGMSSDILSRHMLSIFKFDMEVFIPHKKGYMLDCLDWVPNRGACIDACLSCDVIRSFRFHDIKALYQYHVWKSRGTDGPLPTATDAHGCVKIDSLIFDFKKGFHHTWMETEVNSNNK